MEITTPTAATEQRDEQRRKLPGRPWPPGTSGNPNGRRSVSKRVAVLFETLAADFDADTLSAIDRVLLEQAARLLVRAERAEDADAAVRLSSEARRGLVALRRRRQTASEDEPTLSEVLRARYASAPAVDKPEDEPTIELADVDARAGESPVVSEEPSSDDEVPA